MSGPDLSQQTVQSMAHALLESLPEQYRPEEALAALLTVYVSMAAGLPEFKRLQFGKLLGAAGDEMRASNPFARPVHH
jgi:hypothetical protein